MSSVQNGYQKFMYFQICFTCYYIHGYQKHPKANKNPWDWYVYLPTLDCKKNGSVIFPNGFPVEQLHRSGVVHERVDAVEGRVEGVAGGPPSGPQLSFYHRIYKQTPAPSKGCQLNPKGWWIDTRSTGPCKAPLWRCWHGKSKGVPLL